MAEKKVKMVMKVDLGCDRCFKKIKKVICKFPEIQDQTYEEKQNKVEIVVVSCCPERILEKIKSKGGKTVESIEMVSEKKPDKKDGDKKDGDKKDGGKPKEAEKKKDGDKPKEGDKKKDAPAAEKTKEGEKKKDGGGDKPKGEAQVQKSMVEPASGYPTIYPGGMYYQPPQPYYQGYGAMPYGAMPYSHGVPAYYSESSYGVNRGYNTNHPDYFSEENPESCTVM